MADVMPERRSSATLQVTCTYLFHELPPAVRRAAAAEMARVLRPGGLLVLTDSIQLGDRPALDANLGRFGDFNEPYYRSYISEDFGAPARHRLCLPGSHSSTYLSG